MLDLTDAARKEEGVPFKVIIDVLEAKCVCGAARFESTATGNSNCHPAPGQSTQRRIKWQQACDAFYSFMLVSVFVAGLYLS